MPVQALEPYDTIFTIFDGLTPDEQTEMLDDRRWRMDDQTEDAFATLADSYFAEDSRHDLGTTSRWLTLQTARHAPGPGRGGLRPDGRAR